MSLVQGRILNAALEIKVSAVAQARDSSMIKQGSMIKSFLCFFFLQGHLSWGPRN